MAFGKPGLCWVDFIRYPLPLKLQWRFDRLNKNDWVRRVTAKQGVWLHPLNQMVLKRLQVQSHIRNERHVWRDNHRRGNYFRWPVQCVWHLFWPVGGLWLPRLQKLSFDCKKLLRSKDRGPWGMYSISRVLTMGRKAKRWKGHGDKRNVVHNQQAKLLRSRFSKK